MATVKPAKRLTATPVQSGNHKLIDIVDEAMMGPSRSRTWNVALMYPNIFDLCSGSAAMYQRSEGSIKHLST